MRAWVDAALLAWLGGCAGPAGHDGTTRWMAQLYRALAISADAASVRLQYGEVVPANSVQEHDPFCVIELDTVRRHPQTLRGMRCAWNQTAPGNRSLMRHFTLDEIHAALGDWMRLVPVRGEMP